MNWKGCGKELPWPILPSLSPGIFLEGGEGKTLKDFIVVTVQVTFETGTSESN